jgi:hypothetical protein
MRNNLSQEFATMGNRDEATISIRGVFTNVRVIDPEVGISDFIPIRLIINAGNAVYLKATGQKDVISSISLEAEFIDNKTKRRLFAMAATKELDATVTSDQEGNIRALKEVLDTWARNLVINIK